MTQDFYLIYNVIRECVCMPGYASIYTLYYILSLYRGVQGHIRLCIYINPCTGVQGML